MNVRLIDAADAAACNAFHNRIYGKRRTQAQWEWEFGVQEPHPFAIVEEHGEILGTQALIPMRLIDETGEYASAKSEETLLDPVTRGKDMFRRMYDLIFDAAEAQGIRVIWGFTAAIKPFEKVGFNIPTRTAQLLFPISTTALQLVIEDFAKSAASKRRLLEAAFSVAAAASACVLSLSRLSTRGIHLETLESAPEAAGDVCRRFIGQWGGTTIMRDAAFLQWRLFDNPYVRPIVRAAYRDGRLQGWIAYALDEHSMGYIVDIMAAPEEGHPAAQALVGMLLQDATQALKRMGAVGIRGWTVTQHPFDRLVSRVARRLGYYRIRRGEPMVIRPLSTAHASVGEIDRWYITRIFTEGLTG